MVFKSLANPKTKVKVGCWNVRTMYSVGKTAQITRKSSPILLNPLTPRSDRYINSSNNFNTLSRT